MNKPNRLSSFIGTEIVDGDRRLDLWRASRAGAENDIQDAGARFVRAGSHESVFFYFCKDVFPL